MSVRLGRSVLIGGVAAGAVLALDIRGSFGADLDNFFPPNVVGAQSRLNSPNTAQPFLALFQQDHTSVSQTSSSSFSSGIFGFKTDTDFRDTARTDGTSYMGSFIGNSAKWQQNQVGYTNSQMDLGETIRVKTRFGASTYDASAEFFNSLGQKKAPEDQRALRFASQPGPASGAAALTRVEADILKLGNVNVTLFQEFAQVNSLFEDIKFSDKALRKQTKEDVFSTPDRQTEKYGVALAQGSSGIMFSQSSISDLSGTASSFYREQRFNSKVWLGLRDITQGFSKSPNSALENLVPSNVYVGYSEGAVRQIAGATTLTGGATSVAPIPLGTTAAAITNGGITTDATIRNLDAGLSWQWGGSYATAGVWRSQQVSNLSTLPTPYFSDGADINLGVQEKKWSASAYTSLSRSSNQDGANYSGNYSLSGGASFSVLLEHWPTVTLSFDVSNYDGIYTAWDGKESGRTKSAGIAFDFSKYLVESRGQKLKFFYYVRNEGYDSQWGVANSHGLTVNHIFGTAFRTSL
jgi:hypothetical protein